MDWSTFVPDIIAGSISGLFTGITVGFVLWRTQSKREERQKEWEVKKEVSLLKDQLEISILNTEDVVNITSAEKSIPLVVIEVMEIVKGFPIHIYEEYVNNNFIINLIQLKKEYLRFNKTSKELDQRMEAFIRLYNAERNSIETNDGYFLSYFIGRINSYSNEQIQPWILPHKTLGKEEPYDRFYKVNINIIDEYKASRETLLNIVKDLKIGYLQ
ncbi:hypothetical protein [Paenibacillus radicis (ex Xue et al. 2023)]|uniref:Uncharacterized protein n=1 Tax=Paenibacillus radicis (ex Xue et al. 2023) TaxID=2972489 RepID=A0ABT1YNQ3_9BACL|nr:hypothetical protein [Paenibacillus radicis (ex Xue et al. 2023)]MCR8633913.1 hypothetical protein [Paenibacillus radicis (ex Xue et al. 2023)]